MLVHSLIISEGSLVKLLTPNVVEEKNKKIKSDFLPSKTLGRIIMIKLTSKIIHLYTKKSHLLTALTTIYNYNFLVNAILK